MEALIETPARLLNKVRFRQIRCFVEVSRQGSFMAASGVLGLPQPAVSRSIRELETTLDVTLFHRSQRGAVHDRAGLQALRRRRGRTAAADRGLHATLGPDASHELLRIGALPNVCGLTLPAIVEDFRLVYPQTTVRVVAEINAGLRQGALDLVIGRLAESATMHGLSFQHLYDESIVFAVGRDHPLAAPGAEANLQAALG